jgi:hypothetical protein
MKIISNNGLLSIDLTELNKIKARNQFGNPLAVGETLVLNLSTKTVTVDKEELPIFDIGDNRSIQLNFLLDYILEDKNLEVSNPETINACLPRAIEPRTFRTYLEENEGKFPASITITRRVKAGATQEFLTKDEAKGAVRKKAYEMHGVDHTLENFPVIFNKSGASVKNKDSWKFIDRIVVEVAAA